MGQQTSSEILFQFIFSAFEVNECQIETGVTPRDHYHDVEKTLTLLIHQFDLKQTLKIDLSYR